MLELLNRIDELASQSRKIADARACEDLLRFCNNAYEVGVNLSKELVECRRKNKLSPRSEELLKKMDESIEHIEKMLTFAKLKYPHRK